MSKDKYEDYDYDYDNDLDYDDNNINFEITTNNTTVITNTIVNTTTVVDTVIINQNKTKNYIYGTRRKDYLTGTDADDVICGYNANDTLIGGLGVDELRGGRGKNTYSSAPDSVTDFIYIQRDNKVDKITSIGLEDRVVIKGPHISISETDRGIGVFYKDRLQALYIGDELSFAEFKSIVV
jgi:Ca2+-binding RTX toxin-like protein